MCVLPSANKPKQILALLALAGGEGVSIPDLIQELWGTNPPRSAHNTLQTYILRLRRKLDAALSTDGVTRPKDVLVTFYRGYRLNLEQDELDAHGFEHKVRAGRLAAESGDDENASRLLEEALGQWTGPALADIPTGCILGAEARRLEENRLTALEQRLEADLRLGRHHQILGQLTSLTAHHPLNENLHALHMVALHRSGRAGEALRVFIQLRDSLVNELGMEPSHRLQRLQQAVLLADPVLDSRECLSDALAKA
ncbi:DNA-binding SARP family transcriptional activator [Actinopolyspora lacussalsi]|nr:DNA-binding SARP family transcriptional activator [Actinopolyspora lacussalsi]